MKKLLIFVFFLFPGLANAVDANTKFTWSARAFSEVMKDMRTQCETTDADMFLDIGNWALDNRFYLSYNDLKDKCLSVAKFHKVERGKQGKACQMPLPCYDENTCSERSVINTGVTGCDIYIGSLQKIHNEYADIQKRGKPGTYVVEGDDENVLRVVDVILPKDYLKSDGSINEVANKYSANCIIWKVQKMPDGRFSIIDTGLKTWTADMFFDVQNTESDSGGVRGVMAEPIFLNRDVTDIMYDKFDNDMGRNYASVVRAIRLLPGNDYDVKNSSSFGQVAEPEGTSTTDNGHGAIFAGRVANYDWLGHFLYGMMREDDVPSDGIHDAFAQGLDKAVESNKNRFAWDMGADLVKGWNNNVDRTTFVNVQLSERKVALAKSAYDVNGNPAVGNTMPEAFAIAKCKFMKEFPGASWDSVKCSGVCRRYLTIGRLNATVNLIKGLVNSDEFDDVVTCRGRSGDRYLRKQYVFNDICDSGDTSDTYQQLYQRYCR